MTRQHNSSCQHVEDFIVVSPMRHDDPAAENVHQVKQLAERILATCSHIEASNESRTFAGVKQHTCEHETQTESSSSSEECVHNQCNERYRSDVELFKHKLKEVVAMNVNWQLLHEKQEQTIAELKQTILELQQLARNSPSTESSQPTRVPMTTEVCQGSVAAPDDVVRRRDSSTGNDDDVETLTRKCIQLETVKTELESRNRCLQAQLDSTQDVVKQLEQAVNELNGNVDSISREKQSFIDMLQAQILVYREDFECERHDRERAHGKLAELKTELESLRMRLIDEPIFRVRDSAAHHTADYRVRVAATTPRPTPRYVTHPEPIASTCIQRSPYTHNNETEMAFGARKDRHYKNFGFTMDGYDDTDCDSPAVDLEDSVGPADVTDTPMMTGLATKVTKKIEGDDGKEGIYVTDSASVMESMVVSCPNCLRRFSTDEHVDLMFHLDICS